MPRVKTISREEAFYSKANEQKSEGVGARVGGRLKKAKIVFDPSVNNIPKKITRSLSAGVETKQNKLNNLMDNNSKKSVICSLPPVLEVQVRDCMICRKIDARKSKNLISCKDCNYGVHSSCLKINYLNHALLEEHWRCDTCRTCVVCYETSETGPLVSCCVCVSAYHLGCHTPKLQSNKTLNKFKWECTKCQNINKTVLSRKASSTDNTKQRSSTSSEIISEEKRDSSIPVDKKLTKENIPDISDWSCEKVSKYMEKYFPNEAHIFREHEIDGSSLLLMKRSDIVGGLALKLGPAIRMYSFIVQLQSKSNDLRLAWM